MGDQLSWTNGSDRLHSGLNQTFSLLELKFLFHSIAVGRNGGKAVMGAGAVPIQSVTRCPSLLMVPSLAYCLFEAL